MLHFMGYCVDSSWFRNKEGVLYNNQGEMMKGSEHLHGIHDFTEPEAYRELEPVKNLNINQDSSDEPCGGVQITDPELLPMCGVLHGCKFVLLSTMSYFAYNHELWNPGILHVLRRAYPLRSNPDVMSEMKEAMGPWGHGFQMLS